jgi:HD-GYP domain-containing protein (c-di-GMP phosphodiesterase class II)
MFAGGRFAEKLGMWKPDQDHIYRGALLHDIGKVVIWNSLGHKNYTFKHARFHLAEGLTGMVVW